MNERLIFLLFLLISSFSFSQGITIDTTTNSIPQLVRNVLLGNSCSNEKNFLNSSHRGIGEFTNTNPAFPFSNGIIIRNGIAKETEGPYSAKNESTQITTNTDADLQAISNGNGQSAPITDVAYLQFDFTSLASNFSFDFLFASNEYGQYQCGFSDVFAFLLTDLTTGITTNLAVIPNTTTPVSILNIRNSLYNSSCVSSNANLFSSYNVTNPATSAINMRGETVLLNASSPVIPNRNYRIKLAIGDYTDSRFDSAVFIKGESFTTTINLGPDMAMCQGGSILLDTGLGNQFTFSWTINGVAIPGATNSTLIATKMGKYGVTAMLPASGCVLNDEISISDLQIKTPKDLKVCNSGQAIYQYDLTQNNVNSLGLSSTDYSILYFATLADANANGPEIPVEQLTAYPSSGNQTVYIKVIDLKNANTICNNLVSFDLFINAPVTATTPPTLNLCLSDNGIQRTNLTVQNPKILNGQNPSNYIILYYTSQNDAQNNANAILSPKTFEIDPTLSPQTIWARMEDVSNPACFDVVDFDIIVNPKPPVDTIENVVECSSYTLPVILNGNYYTKPNGTGTLLHAGDIVYARDQESNVVKYYIFNNPNPPYGCVNQSSFTMTFIENLPIPTIGCGGYSVPETPAGKFFTGSGGAGTLLPAGTVLVSNQTIYFYAVINGLVCRDDKLDITIAPLPFVDKPADVVTCDSYTLPVLTNGNYFTEPYGTGTQLKAGDVLSSSQNIYVFANNGTCQNQSQFSVKIVDTSIYHPHIECGSFILPDISFGNYYDQSMGKGNIIPAGTEIKDNQKVYYYATTTTLPNCTDNLNYQITVKPLPPIDTPADRTECGSYVLPPLTNGNYFTALNGGGTPLNAGTIISSTQTIYIFAPSLTGCSNEHSFKVTIRTLPPVDSFTDVPTCTYTLPPLTNGTYYTDSGGPNGSGTIIPAGTLIKVHKKIYIYNQWADSPSCPNETYFTVTGGIDVGIFPDVNACDDYILPPLNVGNYYSQPNGAGTIIPVGTVITTSQTIYVYATTVVDRLSCSDQDDIIISISKTPVLTDNPDVEACGSYTLPTLTLGNYFSGKNGTGTQYLAGQKITASQIMYVYTTAPTNSNCFAEDQFKITVYPLKDLVIPNGAICVDFTTGTLLSPTQLVSGLNPIIYTVDWYFNGIFLGTGPNYTATKEGTYDLVITKKTPDVGNDCGYNPAKVIVEKSSPAIATVTVSNAFTDNIDIIVNLINGFGIYEYKLDDGSFQTDNVFYNAVSGEHTITLRDTKGNCDPIVLIADVIKHPKFFTPNNDGFNDTWNIWDLADQPNSIIYIYDRYGKFLKQLNPTGQGWDGNYNGQPLPSTDYWFQVFYKFNDVDQVFKAHFSMKR